MQAGEVEVRVLGTKFYIQQPSDEKFSVHVDEGKVLVSYKDLHKIVEAGQKVSLDLSKEEMEEVADPIGIDTFWKTRRLVFNLTPIEEVVSIVNKAYDSSILLDTPVEGCSLTVTFENESFENVLEIISSTLNYEVIQDQGIYTLKGDGCQ